MSGPKNEHARKREAPEQLKLSEWYGMPGADLVTRRRQVFGLLGWYHHRVLLPNLGVKGAVVRCYLRIFGTRIRLGGVMHNMGYINRVSPWMSIQLRADYAEEIRDMLGEEEQRGDGIRA